MTNQLIAFDALPSHIPLSPVRASRRLDPFYDALWTDGTQASWLSKARANRSERAGLGRLPRHLKESTDGAWARMENTNSWQQKLDVLGAVDGWRTMSSEQVACLTGHDNVASGTSRATGDLFAADLLEVGVFADAMRPGARQSRGTLFRPARPGSATERMESMMTYAEWVSATAGLGFEFTRQFDRHNLLATELGLRCAEYLRIGTVLGEKLSTVNDLAFSGWGVPTPFASSQQTADLTLVRQDGLRIAVEITASHGKALDAKIAKWAKVLASRPTSESALAVVFIVAGRADSGTYTTAQVLRKTRQAITRSARMNPGYPDDRTASRMMVASWTDWFPADGFASQDFVTLRAERPTAEPANPWTPVDMLDGAQLTYRPSGTTQLALLDNAAGLRSTPHWLRNGRAPQLHDIALRTQGFDEIPRLGGLTDKGRARQRLGAAKGSAGAAKPAARLVF